MRYLATLLLSTSLLAPATFGQLIIVGPRPLPPAPRPAGIILPPQLPAPVPTANALGPRLLHYPPAWYGGPWLPFYPAWEPPAPIVVNNYVPVPVPVLTTPAAPVVVEKKARLLLNLPPNSQVWVNDKPLDAAADPLLVESPDLQAGQRYTFAIKVVWMEGTQREERTRAVTVSVGDQKSLTYFAGK